MHDKSVVGYRAFDFHLKPRGGSTVHRSYQLILYDNTYTIATLESQGEIQTYLIGRQFFQRR